MSTIASRLVVPGLEGLFLLGRLAANTVNPGLKCLGGGDKAKRIWMDASAAAVDNLWIVRVDALLRDSEPTVLEWLSAK